LKFSASVGFIHKEFVVIHGHTILKKNEMWSFAVREAHKLHFQSRKILSMYRSENYAVMNDIIHAADHVFLGN